MRLNILYLSNLLLVWSLLLAGCGHAQNSRSINSGSNASRNRQATAARGKGNYWSNLPAGFEDVGNDDVKRRILTDYGAVYVGCSRAVVPHQVFFANSGELDAWQSKLEIQRENLSGINIELQAAAMRDLLAARAEAARNNLSLQPRGTIAGRRGYAETLRLWLSRVNPGLRHWVAAGKLDAATAKRIGALAPAEQVNEILRLEAKGMYFSKSFDKSILYSVAAPGSSQHLTLLALDIREFSDAGVRAVLARHGWFQTVQGDLPHFTYLGCAETELPARGLRRVTAAGHMYWIPDIQ